MSLTWLCCRPERPSLSGWACFNACWDRGKPRNTHAFGFMGPGGKGIMLCMLAVWLMGSLDAGVAATASAAASKSGRLCSFTHLVILLHMHQLASWFHVLPMFWRVKLVILSHMLFHLHIYKTLKLFHHALTFGLMQIVVGVTLKLTMGKYL